MRISRQNSKILWLTPYFVLPVLLMAQSQPDATAVKPLRTPTWSASRFFHVSGGLSVYNARVAERAEDILTEVERLVGRPAPRFSDTPLFIELVDSVEERAAVATDQVYADFALYQKLIYPVGRANREEDMLEEIVRLVLNRYVLVELGQVERRQNRIKVPEWISVGVAQQISSQSKKRNRQFVETYFRKPAVYLPRDIIEWVEIPDKNTRVRSDCDFLLAKLLNDDPKFLSTSLQTLAHDGGLGWSTIRGSVFIPDPRRERILWDLWLAETVMGKKKPGSFTHIDLSLLDELMSLNRSSLQLFIPPELIQTLTFPVLLERSGEEWAGEVLFRLKMELFALSAAKTGDVQDWAGELQSLLSRILSTQPEDREKNSEKWTQEWMKLERTRQEIMQKWLSVDRYLDAMERELREDGIYRNRSVSP